MAKQAPQTVNQKTYAEMRGVSPSRLRQYVLEGKLTLTDKRQVDVKKADAQLSETLDSESSSLKIKLPKTTAKAKSPEKISVSYNHWKGIREKANAEITLIDLRLRKKELVEVVAVRKAGFNSSRVIRDHLQNISTRTRKDLAVETDEIKCGQIVDDEVDRVLILLSKNKKW